MFRRDYLKWWMRPSFLRSWGRRKPTLFAGPFLGEFGWELMCWQAFVRKQSRHYEKTIVHCPAGREDLYADFASEIIPHAIKCTAECDGAKERDILAQAVASARALAPADADHLLPLGYQPVSRQEFIAFGKRRDDLGCDVLFHPRGRNFGTYRNWELAKWEKLIAEMNRAGLKLGCIGVRSATLDVPGVFTDFRDIPLAKTVDLMASSSLVIGPSSGPMHLASLCRAAHLVWTDRERHARGHRNRLKYESWWNPFGTQAIVLDDAGFDPPVERVAAEVRNFFAAKRD